MKDEQIIFRPTAQQFKSDLMIELWIHLAFFAPCATALIYLESWFITFLCLLPLLLLIPYFRYCKFLKNLDSRCIKIENEKLMQEMPNIPEALKTVDFNGYCSAFLNGKGLGFKLTKQNLSMDMKIQIGMIDLTGYPDREQILNIVNKNIAGTNGLEEITPKQKKDGYILCGIIFVILIVWAILVIIGSPRKVPAHGIMCRSNLKQVGLALLMYGIDNNNKLPHLDNMEGLEMVLKPVEDYKDILSCPKSKLEYKYKAGLSFDIENPNTIPLVWEQGFTHHDEKTVVFLDGHAENLTKDEWEKAQKVPIIKSKPKEKTIEKPIQKSD